MQLMPYLFFKQSLRPLMERLESQFRLQRQTMGILAQLNEAAASNGDNTSGNSGAAAAESSAATSVNDSLPRPMTFGNPHLRHWRAPRREPPERTSSLESRLSYFLNLYFNNCNFFC